MIALCKDSLPISRITKNFRYITHIVNSLCSLELYDDKLKFNIFLGLVAFRKPIFLCSYRVFFLPLLSFLCSVFLSVSQTI